MYSATLRFLYEEWIVGRPVHLSSPKYGKGRSVSDEVASYLTQRARA